MSNTTKSNPQSINFLIGSELFEIVLSKIGEAKFKTVFRFYKKTGQRQDNWDMNIVSQQHPHPGIGALIMQSCIGQEVINIEHFLGHVICLENGLKLDLYADGVEVEVTI